jgi:hypothetical protein
MEYGADQTAAQCVGSAQCVFDEFGAHMLGDRPSRHPP